jgi:hypothetical protein
VKKLSPEGHAAANKLAEFGHKKLPMADEVRQMRAFFDSLPPAIQAEVGDDLLFVDDDAFQKNNRKIISIYYKLEILFYHCYFIILLYYFLNLL